MIVNDPIIRYWGYVAEYVGVYMSAKDLGPEVWGFIRLGV